VAVERRSDQLSKSTVHAPLRAIPKAFHNLRKSNVRTWLEFVARYVAADHRFEAGNVLDWL